MTRILTAVKCSRLSLIEHPGVDLDSASSSAPGFPHGTGHVP